ncbi:MAG: thiamine phosphate synthase [Chloroflexi bacterium]|nr:MAG: thiamine phosphate synthase [Chloroflexota bacterium]
MPRVHGSLRLRVALEAPGQALVRVRQSARGLQREAAPDPQLNPPPRLPGRSPGDAGRVGASALQSARLYIITPDASPERVVAVATAAARGGADLIQLRHKSLPRGELLELARELRRVVGGALFIVNDHVDIALLSGANGVHLGPDDLSIASARRVAGDRLLIGASASTVDAARSATDAGADYIGCGPAFATSIKSQKQVIGPEGVAAVVNALPSVPVFAIGGIDESNLGDLTAIGVRRACVIRAVADAADPEAATRRLRAMLTA